MKNVIIQYWRIFACVCIVFHHTICLFCGDWPPVNSTLLENIPDWLSYCNIQSKTFGLMSFTFISGACLVFQNTDRYSFVQFCWKKIKRILLPTLVFGGLYWLLFPTMMFNVWPAPINGTHLWYLPMIFLCITLTSIHLYSKNSALWIVFLFLLIRKGAIYTELRTLDEFLYYYPVFYAGYVINSLIYSPNQFLKSLLQPTRLNYVISIILLCSSVMLFSKVCGRLNGINNVPVGLFLGIGYVVMCKIGKEAEKVRIYVWRRKRIIDILDRNTFGIYILHQFLINIWWIYGRGILCRISNYYGLLCVMVSTFLGALILSELYNSLKNKFIREK